MKKIISRIFLMLIAALAAAYIIYQLYGWEFAVRKYKDHLIEQMQTEHNQQFAPGEKLVYTCRYLGMPSGKAIFYVNDIGEYKGREVYVFSGWARTSDFISLFFEMQGWVKSYVDRDRLHSLYFEEASQAAGHRKNQKVIVYNQAELYLEVEDERVDILPDTHDPLGVFYRIRLLEREELASGATLNIKSRKRDRYLYLEMEKEQKLETPFGDIDTIKVFFHLKPVEATARHEASGEVWYTDDNKRIPILLKAKTKAGPISIRLLDMQL